MIILKVILATIVLIIIYLGFLSFTTRQNSIRSENDRLLSPCPDKPNCVLSSSTRSRHKIDAFPLLKNDRKKSWNKLVDAILRSGGEILVNDGSYCHAVFTSFVFRFKDDLEIKIGDTEISIRSASRAGTSDLGENRKRVENIRKIYTATKGA